MIPHVRIADGPLAPWRPPPATPGAGAVLLFEGVVRPREGDGIIQALEYQAYEPMATKMLARIAESLAREHDLASISVEHSRGRVPVGEISFRLVIESPHRKEAIRALDEFIDRLKTDVPIWKRPVWRTEPAGAPPPE